jgi:hypothetical protein
MSISFWTLVAFLPILYFGWALVDPITVQEIEDRIAHKRSTPYYGLWALRIRNGLGLVIGLLLLGYSIRSNEIGESASPPQQPAVATAHSLPPPSLDESPALLDRIEGATLQKQIEHQEAMSRNSEAPIAGGS